MSPASKRGQRLKEPECIATWKSPFVRPPSVEANVQFPQVRESGTERTCKDVDEIRRVLFKVGLRLATVPAHVVIVDEGQSLHDMFGGISRNK